MNFVAAVLLLQVGCGSSDEGPVARVLLYLARHQNEDGFWSRPPAHCSCPSSRPLQVRLPVLPDEATRKRFQILREALQADRPSDRDRAQKNLVTLGLPVVPLLQEASTDVDVEVRERCREALVDLWERNPEVKNLFRIVTAPETRDFEVKATSLALLAFLGSGYCQLSRDEVVDRIDPFRRYPYGPMLKKAIRWLTDCQKEDGSFPAIHPETHAMAAVALSESYGMTAAPLLQEPAQKAVTYVQGLQSSEVSFGLWKEFAFQSARLSDLTVPNRDPEPLLLRLREAPSPLSESGTIVVLSFLKRPCGSSMLAFLDFVQARLTAEERFLATFAAGRLWTVGSRARVDWDDETLFGWKRLQITALQCDRGSWSDAPQVFERRLLATIYSALALERTYRYPNALIPDR